MNTASTAAAEPSASDPPEAHRPLGIVTRPERRRQFLMIDPALVIDAGLSHSGACVYAALAFLWFEHVTDVGKLHDLERRAGRKRLDPVVVTADELYALTGLKKDGVAARVRELETPRPCIWRGCPSDHPLVTVRRLGQGRGLQIQRFICGAAQVVPRRRATLPRAKSQTHEDELFITSSALEAMEDKKSPVDECLRSANLTNALEPEKTEIAAQSAAPTSSEAPREPHSQNAALPPSKTRHQRALERGTDAFQNAPEPRFLIGNTEDRRTFKKTAAADPQAAADRTAAAAEVDETTERLVSKLLELARQKEPHYRAETARSVAHRLIAAALEAGLSHQVAIERLFTAVADRRVVSAANPVALLIRGVMGDRRTASSCDRFLLVTASSTRPGHAEKTRGDDEFSALPRDLQELLLERARAGDPIDGSWLRERDVTSKSAAAARKIVDAEQQGTRSTLPLCDALKLAEPERYRRQLEAIFADVSLPPVLGSARSIDHPMILGMCRSRLEQQLASDVNATKAKTDSCVLVPGRVR